VDDFPAAAFAALLSPCLLLTHNYKHFGALTGSSCRRSSSSRLPFRVVGAAMEWATEKIGPLARVILGVGVVGGIVVLQATAGTPPSYAADARARAAGCQERGPRASQGCLRSASAKILGRIQPVR